MAQTAEKQEALHDAEISRLISLSKKAIYSRLDTPHQERDTVFKPRSLVDIAMQARHFEESRQTEEAAPETAQHKAEDDTLAEKNREADQQAATGTQPAAEGQPEDAEAEASTDISAENPADEADQPSETMVTTSALEKAVAEAEERGRTEGETKGHEKGLEEGLEKGRAEGQALAAQQLEHSIQAFEKAALALAGSSSLDTEALMASMQQTILRLASARAGMAITAMPEEFTQQLEQLLGQLRRGTETPIIRLHPDDLSVIEPLASSREKLQQCQFAADPGLDRGDARISIGGIGIDDILALRLGQAENPLAASSDKTSESEDMMETSGNDAASTADAAAAEPASSPEASEEPAAAPPPAPETTDEAPETIADSPIAEAADEASDKAAADSALHAADHDAAVSTADDVEASNTTDDADNDGES